MHAFSLIACLGLFSFNPIEGNEREEERIYINLENLSFTPTAMFLLNGSDVLPVKTLYTDRRGFYIKFDHVVIDGFERPSPKKTDKNKKKDTEEHWDNRPTHIEEKKSNTCVNGHEIYHECGGCANWWCNSRCKCYSPWVN